MLRNSTDRGGNRFDFNPLYDSNASLGRNIGNIFGLLVNYNLVIGTPFPPLTPIITGGPYDVIFNGTTTIPE